MEKKWNAVLAAVLIAVFSVLVTFGQMTEDTVTVKKHQAAVMTDSAKAMEAQTYLNDLAQTGSQVNAVLPQRQKNMPKPALLLFVFLSFSLCIFQKRVFLSYIQFYILPFSRFQCELTIRLKKDGKKRLSAFALAAS